MWTLEIIIMYAAIIGVISAVGYFVIFLIVFIIWTFTLQYRIFQNSIKKYVVNIGVLLV